MKLYDLNAVLASHISSKFESLLPEGSSGEKVLFCAEFSRLLTNHLELFCVAMSFAKADQVPKALKGYRERLRVIGNDVDFIESNWSQYRCLTSEMDVFSVSVMGEAIHLALHDLKLIFPGYFEDNEKNAEILALVQPSNSKEHRFREMIRSMGNRSNAALCKA